MDNLINSISKLKINKGIGAGGSNTNKFGKLFENKTNNEFVIRYKKYDRDVISNSSKCKFNYMYHKQLEDKKIIYLSQSGLKLYIKEKYNICLFRYPDEAYIIENNNGMKILKILEKKEQKVDGSVETKLWSGPSLKREYELMLSNIFKIEYAFCVNEFIKSKITSTIQKYIILNQILKENNIDVLFGDDKNYFDNLKDWIMK